MITYPTTIEESQSRLLDCLHENNLPFHLESYEVLQSLTIYKIIIPAKEALKKRLVLSSGLHGIEGYVGHLMLEAFISEELPLLRQTEVVIYHPINPFGMAYYRRVNEENVDLNRNFSTNNFSSTNKDYEKAIKFFRIKKYHHPFFANVRLMVDIMSILVSQGIQSFKKATLFGQHVMKEGIYFQSDHFQRSTQYMINEIAQIYDEVDDVVWIDLHTGYGPKQSMSIVNSTQEKMTSEQWIHAIGYPRVTALNQADFYLIDGDMIEYLYVHKPSDKHLYATCFEFGTQGETILSQMKSLKAMMFENASYHQPMTRRFKIYAKDLMLNQFRPKSDLWIIKAIEDFHQACRGIMTYYDLF